MSKHVAFLRGINVGGRVIKMADLKLCFEEAGFSNVSTLLQSGNVVFEGNFDDVSKERQKIETTLKKAFSYPAIAFVYPLTSIKKMVNQYPFSSSKDDFQHYVIFLEHGVSEELGKEAKSLNRSIEQIKRAGDIIYWQVKKGFSVRSDFSKNLSKTKYKDFNTVRNIKTLQKLTKF